MAVILLLVYFFLLGFSFIRFPVGEKNLTHRGFPFLIYAMALAFYAPLVFFPLRQRIVVFVVACVLRALALWAEPYTRDYYRYISDGLLLLEGKNPYLDSALLQEVEYLEMKSLYSIFFWPFFLVIASLYKLWPHHSLAKVIPAIFELWLFAFLKKKDKSFLGFGLQILSPSLRFGTRDIWKLYLFSF
ncbi:MAG: hypothetical protein NZM25_00380 [Leptospiraceae bacterium]|nr:hypothetical protein [Leptospiraceae bacterium]